VRWAGGAIPKDPSTVDVEAVRFRIILRQEDLRYDVTICVSWKPHRRFNCWICGKTLLAFSRRTRPYITVSQHERMGATASTQDRVPSAGKTNVDSSVHKSGPNAHKILTMDRRRHSTTLKAEVCRRTNLTSGSIKTATDHGRSSSSSLPMALLLSRPATSEFPNS
jgi:hypothetical protein